MGLYFLDPERIRTIVCFNVVDPAEWRIEGGIFRTPLRDWIQLTIRQQLAGWMKSRITRERCELVFLKFLILLQERYEWLYGNDQIPGIEASCQPEAPPICHAVVLRFVLSIHRLPGLETMLGELSWQVDIPLAGWICWYKKICTYPKTNMEPKNGDLEDEFPFQTGDF